MATASQPEIETLSVVKLTVPVAPSVTAADRETELPACAELVDIVMVVVEAEPGCSTTLGSDGSELPALFRATRVT
jgi:hypothetical protein